MCIILVDKEGGRDREREGGKEEEREREGGERAPMAVQCFQSQHNALCVCVCMVYCMRLLIT